MLDDHRIRALVVARLETLGELSPWGTGVPPAARAAFATRERVMDGVLGDAVDMGALAHPASAARFAPADVLMLQIRDLADRGAALDVDLTHFAARQLELRVSAVLCHELGGNAGRAH